MYDPSLQDRVRIALGLAVLHSKPDDTSLETYLLRLRSSFSSKPASKQLILHTATPTFEAQQALLSRIKTLESQVGSLKRKLVEIEIDASAKVSQQTSALETALSLVETQAQARAQTIKPKQPPAKRQKKPPTAKKSLNAVGSPGILQGTIPAQADTSKSESDQQASSAVPATAATDTPSQKPKQKKKPGPKVGWKNATTNINGTGNLDVDVGGTGNVETPLTAQLGGLAASLPVRTSGSISSADRTSSPTSGSAVTTGSVASGIGSGRNEAGAGFNETTERGMTLSKAKEKGNLVIIGEALDRLLGDKRQHREIDSSGNQIQAQDDRSFGILEALLLPANTSSSRRPDLAQPSLAQTDLGIDVMFDCATSVIVKLGALLEACVDVCTIASSGNPESAITCPKPIIKLIFRILDHVLSGMTSKLTSQPQRSEHYRRGWIEIILLVQRKICTPAIGSFDNIGLAIYTAMERQSGNEDDPKQGGEAEIEKVKMRVLPTILRELDPRKAIEDSLKTLARTLGGSDQANTLSASSTIAEIIASCAMVELVKTASRAVDLVPKSSDGAAGAIIIGQASKETIFHLCRLLSAMIPLLPPDRPQGSLTKTLKQDGKQNTCPETAAAEQLVRNSIRSQLIDALAGIIGLEDSGAASTSLGPFVKRALLNLAEELMLAEGEQGHMQKWLLEGLQAGSEAMTKEHMKLEGEGEAEAADKDI